MTLPLASLPKLSAEEIRLRDEFAGKAMQALIPLQWNGSYESDAVCAYEYADYMLKARKLPVDPDFDLSAVVKE